MSKQSSQRWTARQYGKGASNALEVVMRTVDTLRLPPEEAMIFLRELAATVKRKVQQVDGTCKLGNPFIDRAVNEVLLKLGGQWDSKQEGTEE